MKFYKTIALLTSLVIYSQLHAYKTKWQDSKHKDAEAEFKLDGVIFSGYEFNDYQTNGDPDSTGPSNEKTGFTVGRAYVNFRGKVSEGDYKDWGFRITTDIAPAGSQGDGCASAPCSKNNDYNVYLKYAHIIMPLPVDGMNLVLGQQHVPGVDGKAGLSLQEKWGHRYIDKAATEYLGMSGSTDRGLGLVYKQDYYGLHLLLANGEGYHHNNAEGVSIGSTSLSTLARGGTDSSKSYGLDLYGMPSITPTGANKQFSFTIGLPFRLQNIFGMDAEQEMQTTQVDIATTPTSPTYSQYVGDAKSKRDYSYGLEADMEFQTGELKMGIGVGSIVFVDKRTNAYKLDQNFDPDTNLNPAKPDKFGDYIYLDQDQKGLANFIHASIQYDQIGIFGRYTIATSNTSLSQKSGTSSSKSWEQQLLEKDASNGSFGDLGYLEAVNGYDNAKARTRSYTMGIEYFVTPAFTVAAGITEYWGDNPAGHKFKKNPLSRISNATGSSLDKQFESSALAKELITGKTDGSFESDDFVGQENRQKQVYIRTQFTY